MTKGKILKATHEGVINLGLGGAPLNVAVLEDGTRIVTVSAVFKALGRPVRGNARLINMPVFMDAQNLQPFISEELRAVITKIEYIGVNGKLQEGYDAVILPLVSDLYLKAREAGAIKFPNQMETAQKAEILVRSLAKLGITALIDEATGYQYDREKDELQKILKAYISEELLQWEKRFPDEFYREIFRLNGWAFTVSQIKYGQRPGIIGTWTKKYIYSVLPKGVLEALLKQTPRNEQGKLTKKLHQSLTREQGIEHLNKQIVSAVTLMNVSDTWKDFERFWNKKFGQQQLNFEDAKIIEPKEQSNLKTTFDQQLKGLLAVPPPKKGK